MVRDWTEWAWQKFPLPLREGESSPRGFVRSSAEDDCK